MHETIYAVFELAKFIDSFDTPHSVYINKRVDEYILISQAVTIEAYKEKRRLRRLLHSFRAKKEDVFKDPEMYEYLKTFCNVVTSTYRTSEMITKGIFEYTGI